MGLVKSLTWGALRKDPFAVIERKSIIDREILWKEKTVLETAGTPIVYWKYNRSGDICWCFKDNIPDARHKLCYGTGFLNGYQRYGYRTITWATTSSDITLDNVRIAGRQKELFVLKQGTEGFIETEWVDLSENKEYVYFELFEKTEVPGKSWIEAYYSFDGTNWTQFTDVSTIPFSNKIKFRVYLKRNSIQTRIPTLQYFRFRFRIRPTLREENPRFDVDIPAILAVKSTAERILKQTEQGIVHTFPTSFLVLPEHRLESRDVSMFLVGTYKDLRFYSENNREVTIGEKQRILYVQFDVRFVYKEQDVTGIIYSLD